MPSLINRVPPGFLSLLDIKALGQNPSVLPDELEPSISLDDLYWFDGYQVVSATTTLAAPGTINFGGPNDGYIRRITDVFVRVTTGAGEAADWYIYTFEPVAPTRPIALTTDIVQAASQVRNQVFRGPYYIRSASGLGIAASAVTGTIDIAYGYRYRDLLV